MFEHLKYWWHARKQPGGLLKKTHDPRDSKFSDTLGKTGYQSLTTANLVGPTFQKNQQGHSNCSFQSWANVLSIHFKGEVSARWLTAKAYQQGLCDNKGQAELRVGGKVAQKWGVVLEKDLPSDETLSFADYVNIDFAKYDPLAKALKIGSYHAIDTIDEYLQAIDMGHGVALGRLWLSGMNQGGGFSAPWILSRIGFSIGGHALTGVGYNLKYNGQMVDNELNSYSQNWGDKGHLYCPLIDLQKDIDDYGAYVVSDLAYIPGQAVKVSLLQQVVNMLTDLLEILQKKSL